MSRSHGTNCGAVWRCHNLYLYVPRWRECQAMSVWKLKKGEPQEITQNPGNSPIISGLFHKKKNAHYLHAVRCEDDYIIGFAFCEFCGCKTAKFRVGAHLGPMLEILIRNLPCNFYIIFLCMKGVKAGFWVNIRWCKILNSFFSRNPLDWTIQWNK